MKGVDNYENERQQGMGNREDQVRRKIILRRKGRTQTGREGGNGGRVG